MKKPLLKRPLFWIISIPALIIAVGFLPYFHFLFEYYVYKAEANPAPEDFYESPEVPNWYPKPISEDQVAIKKEEEKVVVNNLKAGYRLELPNDYKVGTWEVEDSYVAINYGDCYTGIENLYGSDGNNETKVADWIEEEKNGGIYERFEEIVDLEPYSDVNAEAYILTSNGPYCNPGELIYFQGKDRVFWIMNTQSCKLDICEEPIKTILNNIEFFEPISNEKVES